jgi:hypothetical protein
MGIHCTIFLTSGHLVSPPSFPFAGEVRGADLARPPRAKAPTDLGRYCRGDVVEGQVGTPCVST